MNRILVAVLDWGLGHATRSIPIIRSLTQQGASVILASSGRAGLLLQKEFPDLLYLPLPPYRVQYRSENMFWNMAWQGPGILYTVFKEHFRLKKIIRAHKIEGVISDSRFGCFNARVPCVFVSHQINIRIPQPILEKIVNALNRWVIQRFDSCWIPDIAGENSLSGDLSYPSQLQNSLHLGVLSRLEQLPKKQENIILVVLSGPEPQRSILEQLIIDQARQLPHQFLIVQGKTNLKARYELTPNIEVISFLTTEALNPILLESQCIISRSGYSTIMDLAFLGKKAILIPTPGQTEQEYLASNLHRRKICYTQKQNELDLKKALEEVASFHGFERDNYQPSQLQAIIKTWLNA